MNDRPLIADHRSLCDLANAEQTKRKFSKLKFSLATTAPDLSYSSRSLPPSKTNGKPLGKSVLAKSVKSLRGSFERNWLVFAKETHVDHQLH